MLRAFTTVTTAVIVLTGSLTPSASAGPVPDEVADAVTAERLAAQSGKSITISSETTETGQVKANPDGSRTLVDYTLPVRVKQNGAWTAVDLTLVQRGDGTVAPKAAPVTMAFTAGGAGSAQRGPVARLVKDTAEVGFGWDTDLPAARLAGSTATYPEVLPGVDLEVQAGLTGFSQSLVVKTPEAAKNPKLAKVTFKSHAKNVTIAKSTTTSVASTQPSAESLVVTNSAGEQVFSGDASAMVDSSQDTRRAVMGVEVGTDTVSITPNQTFLADPNTRYPVRLDPDYYCTSCTKAHHAVVQSPPEWADAHNYDVTAGQLGDLKAGYLNAYSLGASQNGISRTYIAMNTWSLHSRIIHSATLHTKVINSYSCSPTATELWLTNGIDANTTWNNQPAWAWWLSENNRSNNPANCPSDGGADFDATSAVRHIANTNQSYATFVLKAKDEGSLDASWRRFDLNPYLEVHYNTIPNAPVDLGMEGWGPNGADALPCRVGETRASVFTRTPELRARVSDLDGGMLDAGFRVYQGPSTNYTWNGQDLHQDSVPSGSFAKMRVTNDWIPSDGIYTWQLWSGDYEASSWSGLCEFEVDTVAPNSPAVVSTDYPANGIANGSVGQTGSFTFTPNGNTGLNGTMDVDHYGWSLNDVTVGNRVDVSTADGTVVVPITPVIGGKNVLYVQAFDRTGNQSGDPTTYEFKVADPAGPVGAWKLDETTGTTAADSSGRDRPLTLTGGATFGTGYAANGQVGNGTSAYSATSGPIVDTSRAFSVSAWAKLDNTNSWATVVGQDGTRASGFLLEYSKDRDRWTFSAAQSDVDDAIAVRAVSAATPQLGVWTHLLGTYEPNSRKLSLYVNGKLEGTADVALWNAGGALVVGAGKWNGTRGSFFPGAIDHVQVWDRVLSAEEARKHNNLAVLRAQYRLDELTGTTTKDEVSGQNATLAGGVSWAAAPVDPDDPSPVRRSEEKWLNYDSSSTGEATGPRPATLRTDRSYTVSAWVRISGTDGGGRAAVGMGDTKFSPFMLGYRPEWNKWGLLLTESPTGGNGRYALSDAAAQTNTWVHLAATYDAVNGTISLYVNKVKQAAFVNTTGTGLSTFNASGSFLIGRGMWDGQRSDWWKGDVDDARIYSGVLTQEDIKLLFDATPHL